SSRPFLSVAGHLRQFPRDPGAGGARSVTGPRLESRAGVDDGRRLAGWTAANHEGAEPVALYRRGGRALLVWTLLRRPRARLRAGSRGAFRAAPRTRPRLLRRHARDRARSAQPVRARGPTSDAGAAV